MPPPPVPVFDQRRMVQRMKTGTRLVPTRRERAASPFSDSSGAARLPEEDFALAGDGGVAGVAEIGAVALLEGDGDAHRLQAFGVEAHEGGVVGTGGGEGRQ